MAETSDLRALIQELREIKDDLNRRIDDLRDDLNALKQPADRQREREERKRRMRGLVWLGILGGVAETLRRLSGVMRAHPIAAPAVMAVGLTAAVAVATTVTRHAFDHPRRPPATAPPAPRPIPSTTHPTRAPSPSPAPSARRSSSAPASRSNHSVVPPDDENPPQRRRLLPQPDERTTVGELTRVGATPLRTRSPAVPGATPTCLLEVSVTPRARIRLLCGG